MGDELKFFSKELLIEANDAAHREKRSRCINPKLLENYPFDFIYYVVNVFYHKKNELRLSVIIDQNEKTELIDISITRYNSLPSIIFFDNGKFEIKFSERPYPNFCEWQETEIKKPVRQQKKFRNLVLNRYNYTCAVCNINDKALLRASHILDVRHGGIEDINNGICLCVNHEIAFDRGILKIFPDYTVEFSREIGVLVNKLKLPKNICDYPKTENLNKKRFILTATN